MRGQISGVCRRKVRYLWTEEDDSKSRGSEMIEIIERDDGVRLAVRVQTRASRDEVVGEYAGALKVLLSAPPVEGQANEALRDLLSGVLKIPKSAVRIVSGDHSHNKRVEIRGVSARQIRDLLIHEA